MVNRLRDFLVFEYNGPILLNWDYRTDLPRDVPAGEFAARSLEMVDRSHLLVGVLGPTVPGVTRQEILRAYERRARGERMRPYLLADPTLTGTEHNVLLQEIRERFDRDVQYGHYRTYSDLVDQMYLTLFRFIIEYGQAPPLQARVGVIQ